MSLVIVEEVSKIYGSRADTLVTALEAVSLSIDRGEYVAIMGPSGSGKSTLLSILGAMNPPSTGRLLVDGIDVYTLSQERQADLRREFIGFVFQRLELIPYLTALENVMLPLAITKDRDKDGRALDALIRVGLDEKKAKRLPSELSGGEQGRVAIARAIVNDPPLLLADEPIGSLDTATGRQILDLLRELAERGHAVIMVTHNPESTEEVDRVIQIRDGRVSCDDGPLVCAVP
ncbi:MAG: ABC transporter ATP-binding protein [Thermoleophilia bacterium]|jgi:putative ABC transport system ATP-binding protein|nr:ABC transporter ATP-binding protein [Thermoleophilia bacterium]